MMGVLALTSLVQVKTTDAIVRFELVGCWSYLMILREIREAVMAIEVSHLSSFCKVSASRP